MDDTGHERAAHRHKEQISVRTLNHGAPLDAGRAIRLHWWRCWPGASEAVRNRPVNQRQKETI
jgi:hypothetical protein